MTESFRDNYREELTHLPSLYLAIIEECFVYSLFNLHQFLLRDPFVVCAAGVHL